ncbi:hypothetical protein GH714_024233 [Hevea brasiliensis]|uniref:Uncharacterized protein n=1 Tax=Hevea brasiliensis TaxID=3981 RepID=A0A6A6LG65_HEVBR|nr:hypothetical protein GH714_024233 [Hevea brasiliensis]
MIEIIGYPKELGYKNGAKFGLRYLDANKRDMGASVVDSNSNAFAKGKDATNVERVEINGREGENVFDDVRMGESGSNDLNKEDFAEFNEVAEDNEELHSIQGSDDENEGLVEAFNELMPGGA